jgi:hypothetical protein
MQREHFIANFTHLGIYACRIIVPGMSKIYPLDDEECADLLDTLNESGNYADYRQSLAHFYSAATGRSPVQSRTAILQYRSAGNGTQRLRHAPPPARRLRQAACQNALNTRGMLK